MKNKTIFGASQSIRALEEYRNLITEYFSNVQYDDMGMEFADDEETAELRRKINLKNQTSRNLLADVDSFPSVYYTPPPAIGGMAGNIDLLQNIFQLPRFQISPQILLDSIDKGLGIYKDRIVVSVINTLNPFYWFGRILELIASVPFMLLGSVGFNEKALVQSFGGKIIKLIIKFSASAVVVWDVLFRLGFVPYAVDLLLLLGL